MFLVIVVLKKQKRLEMQRLCRIWNLIHQNMNISYNANSLLPQAQIRTNKTMRAFFRNETKAGNSNGDYEYKSLYYTYTFEIINEMRSYCSTMSRMVSTLNKTK